MPDNELKKCPYCAELIRPDAIHCRFCHKSLQWLSVKKFLPAGVLALTLLIIAVSAYLILNQHSPIIDMNSAVGIASGTGRIEGSAWLNRGDGMSNLQRGLQVCLCDSGAQEAVSDERIGAVKSVFQQSADAGLGGFGRGMGRLYAQHIQPHTLQAVFTDADGKYRISGIRPGSYFVFAQSSDAIQTCIWMIPVTVTFGANVRVDLGNQNTLMIVPNLPSGG